MGRLFVSLFIALLLLPKVLYCQNLTTADVRDYARHMNKQMRGVQVGNGVTFKRCESIDKTLVYKYTVALNWFAPQNFKERLISGFIYTGEANFFLENDISVEVQCLKRGSVYRRIRIEPHEFTITPTSLGDYVSIAGHPKAKGVNLQFKVPIGWQVEEGLRPNIVKRVSNEDVFILVNVGENVSFFSRRDALDLLSDETYVDELVKDILSSISNVRVIDKSIMTIDTYPTLCIKYNGQMERAGFTSTLSNKMWLVFYEDKFVSFHASGSRESSIDENEQLLNLIMNSVIFPEQYER